MNDASRFAARMLVVCDETTTAPATISSASRPVNNPIWTIIHCGMSSSRSHLAPSTNKLIPEYEAINGSAVEANSFPR